MRRFVFATLLILTGILSAVSIPGQEYVYEQTDGVINFYEGEPPSRAAAQAILDSYVLEALKHLEKYGVMFKPTADAIKDFPIVVVMSKVIAYFITEYDKTPTDWRDLLLLFVPVLDLPASVRNPWLMATIFSFAAHAYPPKEHNITCVYGGGSTYLLRFTCEHTQCDLTPFYDTGYIPSIKALAHPAYGMMISYVAFMYRISAVSWLYEISEGYSEVIASIGAMQATACTTFNIYQLAAFRDAVLSSTSIILFIAGHYMAPQQRPEEFYVSPKVIRAISSTYEKVMRWKSEVLSKMRLRQSEIEKKFEVYLKRGD